MIRKGWTTTLPKPQEGDCYVDHQNHLHEFSDGQWHDLGEMTPRELLRVKIMNRLTRDLSLHHHDPPPR